MTTVGFVGGSPHTAAGKLISAVLMVLGFGLLAMTTAAIASLFVREDEQAEDERERIFEREMLEELREVKARLDQIRAQMNLGLHRDSGHPSAERLPTDERSGPPGGAAGSLRHRDQGGAAVGEPDRRRVGDVPPVGLGVP